jgi:hypothetical protein
VFGIETFENPGHSANAIFVGAVAHCNTAAGEDGLGNHLAIIRKGEIVEHPGSTGGALLEALAEGECRRRDQGCLGSGTGVAEVGGMKKNGGRLEVRGWRGDGSASHGEEPLGLAGSSSCTREIGMRGPGAVPEVVQTVLPRRIEPRESRIREPWTQRLGKQALGEVESLVQCLLPDAPEGWRWARLGRRPVEGGMGRVALPIPCQRRDRASIATADIRQGGDLEKEPTGIELL